jgi:hypothetical protein
MKIKNQVLVLSTATLVALSGCTGEATPAPQTSAPQDPNLCYEQNMQAPNWVCDPTVEGGLSAVGVAAPNKAGMRTLQQQEARANAMTEIASQMGLKVKSMFKNFAQTTGVGDDQTAEKVSTSVTKQITKQTIEGAKKVGQWKAPDGTLFVHYVVDPQTAQEVAKQTVTTSLKNDQALYQQFIAKKAQAELDAEIDKEFGGMSGE